MSILQCFKYGDLIDHNFQDPDDSNEPREVVIYCPLENNRQVAIFDYVLENDGGTETVYFGEYAAFDLERFNIHFDHKQLQRYYKACILEKEYDLGQTYPSRHVHIFEYVDGQHKIVETECFIINKDSVWNCKLVDTINELDELKGFDVIGLTKQNQLICGGYLDTLESNDLPIQYEDLQSLASSNEPCDMDKSKLFVK